MMTRNGGKNRDQIEFTSLEELVPEDHLVRKLENAIDWSFIYELVKDSYCEDNGRPSLDPVILIKLAVIQFMFGIRSMRQTIQEIKVNMAYRWFLGLGLHDSVPHFSTFGKNYMRRFQNTDLFERIFQRILKECMETGLVDESVVFVDSTHVKARANSKKYEDAVVEEQAQWYEKELREEIDRDREAHGKKPLKDEPEETKDDEDPKPPKENGKGKPNPNTSKKKKARQKKEKHIKQSTSDPESGWFRKGEHKNVFAYSVETACDINGVVLGYSVHPGNENDGKTFPGVYEKIKHLDIKVMVGDTAYKTPAIAKKMKDDGIDLLSTYAGPKTKDGFFLKHEYVYDEFFDCYLCPANEILSYSTTNRDGYREYKSDPRICEHCPHLNQCTLSQTHVKVVTRHVWQDAVEEADENRYRYDLKDLYKYRKETIERIFGLAKELHGFRYTQQVGKAQMEVKAALTYACLNLKKLAKKRWKTRPIPSFFHLLFGHIFQFFQHLCRKPAFGLNQKRVCLRSESPPFGGLSDCSGYSAPAGGFFSGKYSRYRPRKTPVSSRNAKLLESHAGKSSYSIMLKISMPVIGIVRNAIESGTVSSRLKNTRIIRTTSSSVQARTIRNPGRPARRMDWKR